MKIVVLGSTGMLGNTVGKYFVSKYGGKKVSLSYRNKKISYGEKSFYFDVIKYFNFPNNKLKLPECDYVINCIGSIKQHKNWNTYEAIKINSCFPWELAKYCEENDTRLIHVTTDCVFSGKDGKYTENSLHDELDEYGKTKSLGEVESKNAMVLRTSIIGEELHTNVSLLSWVKSQQGKVIKGYTNHFWNGITTLQYAKVCDNIIKYDLYRSGLYHIFSDIVNKYELVSMINNYFNLKIRIEPFNTEFKCDRTLSTCKTLNDELNISSIKKQIKNISKD